MSLLSEQTTKFLDVATYQTHPDEPVDLTESDEVVSSRISSAVDHLSRMFGSHKQATQHSVINEAVNAQLSKNKQDGVKQRNIAVGDTVQTIMQGQQKGTVEKIEKTNGIVKVYHRHENGNLYASSPSNLRIINEAYGDVKHDLSNTTLSDREIKKNLVDEHLAVIHDLKSRIASAKTPEEESVHQAAHDLEVAKLANTQTYVPGGIVECADEVNTLTTAISHILEQLDIGDISQLDESAQKELISVAIDLAPHL